MNTTKPSSGRVETVLGAVLYLMTAYCRTPCPRLASCIASHLDCVAAHPQADSTIRHVCAGMSKEWHLAGAPAHPRKDVH